MAKILKVIVIILVIGFLGFVGWMNVTPGHFQEICCGEVGYITNEQKYVMDCEVCAPIIYPWTWQIKNGLLLVLGYLDFYK